jgi:hypothetical protein
LVRNHSQKAADAARGDLGTRAATEQRKRKAITEADIFALNDGPRSIASSYMVKAEVQAHSTATVTTTTTLTDAECAQF